VTGVRESIPDALAGERIDRVVALLGGVSRSEASELVAAGAVRVGGRPVTTRSARVDAGDLVEFTVPAPAEERGLTPDSGIEFDVVHVDDYVIVVDKPAGLVVHPGAGRSTQTLVHGLLSRFPELARVGDPRRPGIVHRLDKDTSGLLAVARTPAAYEGLVGQLAARRVERAYLALVWGTPAAGRGTIEAPIGRSARAATRMAVSTGGRAARTHYRVERSFAQPVEVSLLRCRLETGRTHQIRVHLAAIDHPIVGDKTYGGARQSFPVPRFFLHATQLGFTHPVSGEPMAFTSSLPPDLAQVLERLGP
jgi:23S rRNA pseudouridine1911/1915/1917 synthase